MRVWKHVPGSILVSTLCSVVLAASCNTGEINQHYLDGPDEEGAIDRDDGSSTTGPDSGSVDPSDPTDPTDPTDLPDMGGPAPYDLALCEANMFWPVDSPLRALTPEQLYRTASQAFYPGGDPRVSASIYQEGGLRLAKWIDTPRAGVRSGLVVTFPDPGWSEDSYTNRAKPLTTFQIEGSEKFANWFFSFTNSRPFDSRYMYGTDEIEGWAPCKPERSATREDLLACGEQMIDRILPKLMRRTITPEQRQSYVDFLTISIDRHLTPDVTRPDTVFVQGIKDFFVAVMQTPQFLYHLEAPDGEMLGDGQAAKLSGFDLANRLSFFLWNSPPDDILWKVAEDGSLDDEEVYEAQVRRMLADPRSRSTINQFFAGWLKLEKLDKLDMAHNQQKIRDFQESIPESELIPPAECANRTPVARPSWQSIRGWLTESLRESALRYVDWAFWEADSFEAFMAGDQMFSNALLSNYYEWPAVAQNQDVEPQTGTYDNDVCSQGGRHNTIRRKLISSYERITIPNNERTGILTHPGLLTMSSHDGKHSAIFRGVHMLNAVLCQEVGFPEGLGEGFGGQDAGDDVCTTREYITQTHTSLPGCESCHGLIDGLGFSFEHYNLYGDYVTEDGHTQDKKCQVDASTTIPEQTGVNAPLDFSGQVNDATELAPLLAGSRSVKACMVSHLLRFSQGRRELSVTAGLSSDRLAAHRSCQQHQIQTLVDKLDDSGGSFQELLVQMMLSPAFRYKAIDPTFQDSDGGTP